jgi:hypothetical protein
LADLLADPAALRRLIDEGETLIVERKEAIPGEGLGPTVASFANTYGGWLLLGVADDKKIKGYDPGAGDFTDRVRHLLRNQVDPMPPFAAQMVPIDAAQLGVVRVYESADRPHMVLGTGAVFVREPGGKRAVRDHRELLQLAQYGRDAARSARERLTMLDYPSAALDAPELQFPGHRGPGPVPGLQVIVMAVPMTVQSGFADRSLAAQTGRDCIDLAREIFPGPAPADLAHWAQGMSMDRRGFKATMTQRGHGDEVAIIVDVGGLIALRFQYARDNNTGPHPNRFAGLHPTTFADSDLVPLLSGAARLLTGLDAFGRAICQLILRGFGGLDVSESRYGAGVIPEDSIRIDGELSIPPDDGEIAEQADRWAKAVARAAGLEAWQS